MFPPRLLFKELVTSEENINYLFWINNGLFFIKLNQVKRLSSSSTNIYYICKRFCSIAHRNYSTQPAYVNFGEAVKCERASLPLTRWRSAGLRCRPESPSGMLVACRVSDKPPRRRRATRRRPSRRPLARPRMSSMYASYIISYIPHSDRMVRFG